MSVSVMARIALGVFLLDAAAAAHAQQETNICRYALDGECDEPGIGTGLCKPRTDAWDCRQAGTFGPDACFWANDNECDEASGTGLCPAGSDTTDCAAAASDLARTFFGADDRTYPDSREAPWRMIGRLEMESGGHCTATVVGPRLVLTAAHCLFTDDGGRDPAATFVAGADEDREVARAAAVRDWIAPGFDFQRHEDTNEIDGLDWAFVELDRDLAPITGAMTVRRVDADELRQATSGGWPDLTQAGYSRDSATRLSAHVGCEIVRVFDDDTVFHRCDTLEGDSGSPFFIAVDGGWQIVAIESATYENANADFDDNMAVDARAFWGMWNSLMSGKVK